MPLAEPANPIDLYLLIGDDHVEGHGNSALLPSYLTGAVSGIKIWNPHIGTPAFQDLQVNVNNMSTSGTNVNRFGLEFSFGEEARQATRRTVYLVKGALDGSFLASHTGALPSAGGFPFFDDECNDWNPASTDKLYNRVIEGWAQDAVDSQVLANVRLRGIIISAGSHDAAEPDGGLQANETGGTCRSLINRIRYWAQDIQIAAADTPVPAVVILPDSRYTTRTYVGTVRSQLQALPDMDPTIAVLDPSSLTLAGDGFHYDSFSTMQLGQKAHAALTTAVGATVEPLFCPSREYLVKGLRLRDLPTDVNAQDLINESILAVRASFYRRIGLEGITAVQAIAFTKHPATASDYRRLLAQTTETKWVRLELMRIMPMQFVDGSAADQSWQHEAAFRSATGAQVAAEIKQLRAEIDAALDIIAGNAEATESLDIKIQTYGPDGTPAQPGDTVWVQGGAF